jgi:hypothetical protein
MGDVVLSLRLDVYLHQTNETALQKDLSFIRSSLATLATQGAIMAGELARLQTEVTEMAGVVDSAIVLINGLAQQIRDLAGDPVALAKMADDLDAKAGALAAAVVANTPTP